MPDRPCPPEHATDIAGSYQKGANLGSGGTPHAQPYINADNVGFLTVT